MKCAAKLLNKKNGVWVGFFLNGREQAVILKGNVLLTTIIIIIVEWA